MPKSATVLSLLSFLILYTGSADAGTISPRIINGEKSQDASEYSVHIEAWFLNQLRTYGGGTLISTTVVLTEAEVVMGYQDFTVRFGSAEMDGSSMVYASDVVWHPNYEQRTQLHDIALMRLQYPVDQISHAIMRPVKIYKGPSVSTSIDSNEGAELTEVGRIEKKLISSRDDCVSSSSSCSESDSDSDTEGLIVGFGMESTAPWRIPMIQNYMHQTEVTDSECRSLLGSRRALLMSSHFCAMDRRTNASSACIYDNGAGFIVNEDGVNYVVGVLSLATNMCRPQFPNMYTRVSDYTEWIEQYLELWAAQ